MSSLTMTNDDLIIADLDASLKAVTDNGGKLIGSIREGDGSRYAIIQDPAGAYAGLLAYT